MVLGSRLVPQHSHDGCKLICHLPRLQEKSASHQNQRICRVFSSGWFWCWDDCCSFTFFCSLPTECTPRSKERLVVKYLRVFIFFTSGTNLVSLVLESYVAVVKPLKYLTFMKHRRVIQRVLTSWGIPFLFALTVVSIKLSAIERARTKHGY